MSGTFDLFGPRTLPDTGNATSSPASGSGATPCASPDGATTSPRGPEAAPASLSAPPAVARGMRTSATYGRLGSGSSASRALSCALASRFQATTARLGSTMWDMIWKASDTPSGRYLPRLVVSARRTNDSASTSWPTTAARDWKSSASNKHGHNARPLNEVARLAAWATPLAADGDKADCTLEAVIRRQGKGKRLSVAQQARLTASGATRPGCNAATGKPGQLNPAHSRWLMGLPPAWDDCAPTATRSSRRSRPSSSAPIEKSGEQHE